MKHRLDSVSVFADESGERLRKMQVLARFCAAVLVAVVIVVVACLASGVSLRGPDLPGFDSKASGDGHRSVTPGAAVPESGDRQASPSADASRDDSGTSTDSGTPAPEPTASSTSPSPAATSDTKAVDTPRADPSHVPGSRPTSPPGKSK